MQASDNVLTLHPRAASNNVPTMYQITAFVLSITLFFAFRIHSIRYLRHVSHHLHLDHYIRLPLLPPLLVIRMNV
ncbi:hypothetical protein M3J09_002120 [Ascochyta lentis]